MTLLTPGYFHSRYFVENCFPDDYWQDYGAPSSIIPQRLTPGYFHTNYWLGSYWNDNYWQNYGSAIIPLIDTRLIEDGYWNGKYWIKGYYSDDYWQDYGSAIAGAHSGYYRRLLSILQQKELDKKKDLYVTFSHDAKITLELYGWVDVLVTQYDKTSTIRVSAEYIEKYGYDGILLLMDEDLWLSEQ